jgi:O-antigen/teichoic acid export membrane protein
VNDLATYGTKNAAINVAQQVIDHVGVLLAGAFLAMTSVTYYSIGLSLVTFAWSACAALAVAFVPHMTHLDATEQRERLVAMTLRGERLLGLFSSVLFGSIILLGGSFIALWLGAQYVSGPLTLRSDTVVILLVVGNLPRVYQSLARQLLFAANKHRQLMWITIGEAIGNVAISLVLIRYLGLAGIALGALLACFVSHLFFLPTYVFKTFGIPFRQYLFEGVGRPLVVLVGLLALGRIAVSGIETDSWLGFLAAGSVCVALGAVLAVALGLTRDERQWLRSWLATRLASGRSG